MVKSNWWQAPSKATDIDEHRVVSTIELFCDLVFVAYVAVVTHGLTADTSLHGILTFVTLFSLGWVIWLNSAQYHDLHGNNDFKTRVITFVQMIFIGLMAAFCEEGLEHGYTGFVVALSGIITVLATLWRGTGIADPSHKVYSRPYSRTYYLGGLFAIASLFFPKAYRWVYLLVITFLLVVPMITNYLFLAKELKYDFVKRMKLSHAFIERSNLFFIIVLGEIIIGSLNGFAKDELGLNAIIIFIFSMLIAFGLWFTHFEFVGHLQHRESIGGYYMWLFSFYLETMMVAALGSSIYLNYKHFSVLSLLLPTGAFFIATLIHFTFNKKMDNPNIKVDTTYTKLYILVSLILLGVTYVVKHEWLQAGLYLLALYLPVLFGLRQWIKHSRIEIGN